MAIESNRIEKLVENIPVKVSHIKKYFGEKAAVKDVSFGLEFGECFALLGVSGAGKSTCFKCLTGETYPSEG
jgi:ABC-type multidrug transport system ATPase subunit